MKNLLVGQYVMVLDYADSWNQMAIKSFGFKHKSSRSFYNDTYTDGTSEKHTHVFVSDPEKEAIEKECWMCNGTGGETKTYTPDDFFNLGLEGEYFAKCSPCEGTGKVIEQPYVRTKWVISRKTHILNLEDYETQIAAPKRLREEQKKQGDKAKAERKANHLDEIIRIVQENAEPKHALADYIRKWDYASVNSATRRNWTYAIQGEIRQAAEQFLADEVKEKAVV